MTISMSPASVCVIAILLSVVLRYAVRRASQPSRPPGPPGYPIVGNALDVDRILDWRSASDLRRQWGDITSICALGTTIVKLHTYEKTVELFEKKSLIYSSRPSFSAPGIEGHVSLLPYGPELHESRRMLRRGINPDIIPTFYAHQEAVVKKLLGALRAKPGQFYALTPWYTGSTILKIVYGYDTQYENDPLVNMAVAGLEYILYATSSESPIMKVPWLRYVPSWLPGAGFKRRTEEGARNYARMRDVPFKLALDNADTTGEQSYVTRWVDDATSRGKLHLFKESALIFFAAGVETTETALSMFFFRMQEMSHIQKKAQAELNSVVGRDRLPTFEDRVNLPYINALCKELIRYDPPIRGGLPHQSTADDVHDGYFIPKGSIVFPSVWEMSREPTKYAHPEIFDPTRFMGPAPALDPAAYIFGFGRRLCSGMLLADTTFFIAVASILAIFDISPPADGTKPEVQYIPGFISHPKPFKCTITPRADVDVSELIAA